MLLFFIKHMAPVSSENCIENTRTTSVDSWLYTIVSKPGVNEWNQYLNQGVKEEESQLCFSVS